MSSRIITSKASSHAATQRRIEQSNICGILQIYLEACEHAMADSGI